MGGSKNKSPAQKEKSQKKDTSKKSKKAEKKDDSKTKTSVIIDEGKATKYINDAKVTITNIEGGNGVIHVIDSVLIPSNH